MTVAQLNRLMTLQAAQQLPDGAGGFETVWADLGQLWAAVEVRSARSVNDIAGQVSLTKKRVTVRGAPVGAASRPVAGQRFVEGDRLYLITAVNEADPDARFLECHVTEEVPA